MFNGLFNIVFTDYTGGGNDLRFMKEASWLNNAAVIPHVYCCEAGWRIIITFAWVNNPYRFICRSIPENFVNEKKALLYAEFYCRASQKDKRGSLIINTNDITIHYN